MSVTSAPTLQQRMQAKLAQSGIPWREIKVFGSSILITCQSRDTAQRWASLLAQFARVTGVGEGYDEAKVSKGTCLLPSKVAVWRVGARIV